jgi:hypothetical protein
MLFAKRVFTLVTLFAVVGCTAAAEPPAKKEPEQPKLYKSEKYGLIFWYSGDASVKDFVKSTPCVTGVWWKFHREDEKHWIGELHYPTENTGNYADDAKNRSPQYYMVFDLAIRKQKNLPIDLKTFRGALVLRDPKPDVPLSTRGDGTSYELVGYEDKENKGGDAGFLFARHSDLRYVPSKKKAAGSDMK